MNLRTHDRSGLYEKLAARRAVRRQRRQFEEILGSSGSPAMQQEIQAIYTRYNAQLGPSAVPGRPAAPAGRRILHGAHSHG